MKPTTIHLILTFAISFGQVIWELDVKNTFLYGDLSKDVYMTQPLGFVKAYYLNHVCKLNESLYGL